MERIKEDYCNFEISKLLKEKGFKGEGEHFYENNKIIDYINYWDRITPKQRYEAIEAPTLQTAMKWLREVHNISIEVIYDCSNDKTETISWWLANIKHINSDSSKENDCLTAYNSYEEACEAAIHYCLEHLI